MALIDRRGALSLLAGFFVLGHEEAGAVQRRAVRRARRRVRRRVRRRIRRRVAFRTIAGRRLWVAPVALAVGWELLLDTNRVVVVKETKFVERNGSRVEVAVVQSTDGKTEEVEFVREDTSENGKDLPGTVLADSDKTTPSIEKEEEVEVDD
jgi:hypothetical protein